MNLTFEGPAGRLEGVLWLPETAAPRAAAVVAHPHPLGGGTMKNNVVYRAARGLQAAGLAVLRFNFRGVGRSAGVHDGAGAEEGDYRAALDELERRAPGLELWAGGFSFGARTALPVALADRRVARVLLVAPPVKAYPCAELARLALPGLILTAGEDEFGNLADLAERFPRLHPELERVEIPGVGHFFAGVLTELQEIVRAWAVRSLAPSPR